jgi:hypothetical protein
MTRTAAGCWSAVRLKLKADERQLGRVSDGMDVGNQSVVGLEQEKGEELAVPEGEHAGATI